MAYNYEWANPLYYDLLKDFAKENRRFQTEAESMLWNYLRTNQLGLHFRRQHIIGCYIADFVCLTTKTIIEIDGGYHSQHEQEIKDYYRTEDLNRLGFTVIRFKNEEIYSNLSSVLDRIFNTISKKINPQNT